ncbi:MAG: [Clostridia bacterium]|nr:[FeFe] hydrogenase H-cluster radical SAM maturase HydE [Clostridia bacterium]
MTDIINKLYEKSEITESDLKKLISNDDFNDYLIKKAVEVRKKHFGNKVYIRALIEISNICKNDCYYCGIRKSNSVCDRYRLTKEEILECAQKGYELGFRTFVMQGGEDGFFTDSYMADVVSEIKKRYPDCAVTLSLGEKSFESYKMLFDAGADRYLLRHETADEAHYGKLHPESMSFKKRMSCINSLKEIGYQTGIGFMVGSPFQTLDNIVKDLLFIKSINPEMVGIGPFIPHKDTPFCGYSAGSADLTVKLISIIRLLLPKALIPSTTALGSISEGGRERGILAGANVIMPNLSPGNVRSKYSLYNNKLATGLEAAEHLIELKEKIKSIGYEIVTDRGDYNG